MARKLDSKEVGRNLEIHYSQIKPEKWVLRSYFLSASMKKKEENYNYRNTVHVFLAEVIFKSLVFKSSDLVHSRKVVYKVFAGPAKSDDHENQMR